MTNLIKLGKRGNRLPKWIRSAIISNHKWKTKCREGDSHFQTSTGIQRHRLRALFERGNGGNTPEQAGWNRSRSARCDALSRKSGAVVRMHTAQNGWYRGFCIRKFVPGYFSISRDFLYFKIRSKALAAEIVRTWFRSAKIPLPKAVSNEFLHLECEAIKKGDFIYVQRRYT